MDLSYKMVQDIPNVVGHHWKERSFNWPMIIYIGIVHSAALYGISKLSQCSAETLIWAFTLWPIRYVHILIHVYIYIIYRSIYDKLLIDVLSLTNEILFIFFEP